LADAAKAAELKKKMELEIKRKIKEAAAKREKRNAEILAQTKKIEELAKQKRIADELEFAKKEAAKHNEVKRLIYEKHLKDTNETAA